MRQDRYFVDQYENNAGANFVQYVHGGRLLYAHKATEGIGHVDRWHKTRTVDAHSHGLAVMHYHYCRPDQLDTAGEMRNFWDTASRTWQRFDFVALDFESGVKGHSAAFMQDYIEHAWDELKRISGHTGRPYGSTSFLIVNTRRSWMRFRSRWQAQYGPEPGRAPWGTAYWAWQFTNGKDGPEPHGIAGVGSSDVSLLNPYTAIRLRVLLAGRRRAVRQKVA